jgi:hypothetical protein
VTVRSAGPGTAREELGGLRWTHWGLVENFVAHLQTGEPLRCGGAGGRRSAIILDALAEAPTSAPEEWTPMEEH